MQPRRWSSEQASAAQPAKAAVIRKIHANVDDKKVKPIEAANKGTGKEREQAEPAQGQTLRALGAWGRKKEHTQNKPGTQKGTKRSSQGSRHNRKYTLKIKTELLGYYEMELHAVILRLAGELGIIS